MRPCHRPAVSRLFRTEPLLEIIAYLETGDSLSIAVPDPDLGRGLYAGEPTDHGIHRPFRTWVDLAERLGLRILTPRPLAPPLIELRFERLDRAAKLRLDPADPTERYGASSEFARISKLEDPSFVLDLRDALVRVRVLSDGQYGPLHITTPGRAAVRDLSAAVSSQPQITTPGRGRVRILDLGVNTGDEIALLRGLGVGQADAEIVGVDHSASALDVARTRFPDVTLIEANLGSLAGLGLGRFDVVMSFGTLQSPGIDDRELVRRIVQDHLTPEGGVILGFPNARYVDGEIEHGTRMKNFRQPELGLLVKDVAFYRKYLQQHGRQVFVTGKYELLITGVMAPGPDRADASAG